MISYSRRKWMAIIYLLVVPSSVDPQMAMYPMFPPSVHIAVPMPVPMPIMVRQQDETTRTTTTTTTTERPRVNIAFPVPMPMPMPMPFAFPAFPAISCQAKNRPKGCPPCPPCQCIASCTPAFFSYCSPCHQKCRCRSQEDTPTPKPPRPPPAAMGPAFGVAVPVPAMFAPPPVVVVPFPPPQQPWGPQSSFSSSSSDGTDLGSDTDCTDESFSSSYERRKKRRKKIGHMKRRPIYRRQFDSLEISNNELVKPVLTYLSQNGDVKLKRKLSNDEAAELINDKPYQKIRVTADDLNGNKPRILVTSNNERNSRKTAKNHRRRQLILTNGQAQHMLREGKKELVFRPPSGKKISNLSVSFQINE